MKKLHIVNSDTSNMPKYILKRGWETFTWGEC